MPCCNLTLWLTWQAQRPLSMADLLTRLCGTGAGPLKLSAREWELLLGQARRSRLLARLALHCAAQPGGLATIDDPQRQYLQGASSASATRCWRSWPICGGRWLT